VPAADNNNKDVPTVYAFTRNPWLTRILTLAAFTVFAAGPAPAASSADAEDALNAKLNAYVDCFNGIDGSAHNTVERYASWVKDMKSGPTGRESVVYGLYQISGSSLTSCREGIAKAHELAPSLPLDAAGAEYIKALDALNQVVEEMYPYYDRENYKDDKFAKGKEMHRRFVAQVAQFKTASKHFSAELETENDKRLEAEMAELEKQDGRKLPYLKMALMHHAKRLVNVMQDDTPAIDQITARMDTYEKAADELVQFSKNNSKGLPIMWSMHERHVEEFRKAAKERMRRLRDKEPYSAGDTMMLQNGAGWMISGSEEKMIRAYNELVNSNNSTH
jgi:hypothetical protein